MTTDLRAKPLSKLFCSDASPFGAGVCQSRIGAEATLELLRHADHKGFHTNLPPDPQGWHPAVDYLALLNCLLPQLRDAEHAGAHVLLLVTDSRNFLSIPHFPDFIRHLVARMQWEGTYREKWFPIFVHTLEAGLAAVHFTWAVPEIMTVLRVLAPGAVLMLLDHDTLFTPDGKPKSYNALQFSTSCQTPCRWSL